MIDPSNLRVISTWPFGIAANAVAWKVLAAGGRALDAAVDGVASCEDDPAVDSVGFGGLPDAAGEVTLDASVMDHDGRCGAVACVRRLRNPIRAARLVMERTPHVLLVGDGADRFGIDHGLLEDTLLSEAAGRRFREWRATAVTLPSHDTISLLALDAHGRLAGACSTSGTAFKVPGRVGDSPIIGSGMYVDGAVGAAAATGVGEEVLKVCGSFAVVENMRRGMAPRDAIADVLTRIARQRGNADTDVSFIALTAGGDAAGMSLRKETKFEFAYFSPTEKALKLAEALSDL